MRRSLAPGEPGSGGWLMPVLISGQALAGFAIGRCWVVRLPIVVVLVSVPAGNPPITPEYVEPFPIWFGLAVAAPVAILLMALGVAARRIHVWRSRTTT